MKKLWILVAIMGVFAKPIFANAKDVRVTVNGMVCGFCAQGITKKFKKEDSVESVDVKLEKKTVTLVLKDKKDIPDSQITHILKDAGYSVEKIERN